MARLILIAMLLAWLGAPAALARLPDARERPQDISKIASDPFTIALAASVAGARALRTVGWRRQGASIREPMSAPLTPFWAHPFEADRFADGSGAAGAFALGSLAASSFGGALNGLPLPLITTFPELDLPSPQAEARPRAAGSTSTAFAFAFALTGLVATQIAIRRRTAARRRVR